jgi:hypothetical protein
MRRRSSVVVLGLALAAVSLAPARAQEKPPVSGAVGIRVTPSNVDPDTLSADFDLTMYTRYGTYPGALAGATFAGIPALDYGDGGTTIPSTTLLLASPGGGPGGSTVYRSPVSFSHTFPALGNYTVITSMSCSYCYLVQYAIFPMGNTPPTTFSYTYDYLPTTVVGNLAASTQFGGTTSTTFGVYSVRYLYSVFNAVTNTAQVSLALPTDLDIPTLHPATLALLGVLLVTAGWWVLRSA